MKDARRWLRLATLAIALGSCPLASASAPFELLKIQPSAESHDYVDNKQQFQLHNLLTEQRHPKTATLSQQIRLNTQQGVEALLSVDEDISDKFIQMAKETALLEQAVKAVTQAIVEGRKIYIYGCGATGRLAKQMESSFWRPFWKKMASLPHWERLKQQFPNIENRLIGEMTGGDRALISSLEGFEDLQLIGRLQLQDHQIQAGDLVFAITEGGETSSVIGTILAAAGSQNERYFIYNNPDSLLLPLDRSRSVINHPEITKISLFTGPQAVTGSTRMQATTSETFLMGMILEQAIQELLTPHLSKQELMTLGFVPGRTLSERLLSFIPLQKAVYAASSQISQLTDLEAATYASNRFSTYFAKEALITLFIDSTERSPTFRLYPLDTIHEPARKCWIQVWTPAESQEQAWSSFLGRPFRGLDPLHYEGPFSTQIEDRYLRRAALNSLKNAGKDQQHLYDFSYSPGRNRAPEAGDLGVMALLADEVEELRSPASPFQSWLSLFAEKQAKVCLILVGQSSPLPADILQIQLPLDTSQDPLKIRQNIGLKMLLNAHSTAVMAKLGRVVGNTMTNVNPGNLKLIGRATYLIQSHVNDHLPKSAQISYREANALLFDAIDYTRRSRQNSEVGLSIIRLLESYRRHTPISWEEADALLQQQGLEGYLYSTAKKRGAVHGTAPLPV
jgi:N-acetylmuramic acid 6-phosphate etherase